ncbi:MAG TPA: hypothetical protein VL126_04245 [Bacteroidota bacterium]|nr:hypothetical protein [Bacteroidota bacterium]
MGLGQTMMTVLAMALLATVMLTVNNNTGDSNNAVQMSQYRIMAASLATTTIEAATGLAFDQNTVSSDISTVSSLTPAASLGCEAGEIDSVESTFNDFDDYAHFHKWVKGDTVFFRSADFRVWSWVDYVQISGDSISHATTQTYNKRIMVYVTSPYMNDTLYYSTIYSYWYFR